MAKILKMIKTIPGIITILVFLGVGTILELFDLLHKIILFLNKIFQYPQALMIILILIIGLWQLYRLAKNYQSKIIRLENYKLQLNKTIKDLDSKKFDKTGLEKRINDLNKEIEELHQKPDLRSVYGMNWTENGDPYCNVLGCFTPAPWKPKGKSDTFLCPKHGPIYGTDPITKKDIGAKTLLKLMEPIDMEEIFKKKKGE